MAQISLWYPVHIFIETDEDEILNDLEVLNMIDQVTNEFSNVDIKDILPGAYTYISNVDNPTIEIIDRHDDAISYSEFYKGI